ncbi:MAG: hypothetical protein PHZ19_05325 [Candidatus Thermoplasmatota archaeon]|nr:hypothetical protein [Candidatus Thermoplasmatota archaeon]
MVMVTLLRGRVPRTATIAFSLSAMLGVVGYVTLMALAGGGVLGGIVIFFVQEFINMLKVI